MTWYEHHLSAPNQCKNESQPEPIGSGCYFYIAFERPIDLEESLLKG
jgi:hypothetical protein